MNGTLLPGTRKLLATEKHVFEICSIRIRMDHLRRMIEIQSMWGGKGGVGNLDPEFVQDRPEFVPIFFSEPQMRPMRELPWGGYAFEYPFVVSSATHSNTFVEYACTMLAPTCYNIH